MPYSRALGQLAAIVAAVMMLAVAGPLQAQEPTPEPSGQADIEVADEELMSFTEAQLEVEEIRQELQIQLQTVQEPEEAQALQQQANDQMVLAIREQGFDVERYTEIVEAVNADPELLEKYEMMKAAIQGEDDSRGR